MYSISTVVCFVQASLHIYTFLILSIFVKRIPIIILLNRIVKLLVVGAIYAPDINKLINLDKKLNKNK